MPLTLNTVGKINKGKLASLCADAITELERACLKFPDFPSELVGEFGMNTALTRQLELVRDRNDSDAGEKATAYSVFVEEYLEFIEAAKSGRHGDARRELVQAMAVLLRTYIHLDDYCPGKQAGNAQRSTLNAQLSSQETEGKRICKRQ